MNIIGQNGNEGLHYEDETDYLLSSEKNKEHLEESIQQADSIDNLDIQELEELKSRTAKTNKYGPKGWKTIDKRINELRARKNDDDDLIIRY